MTITITIAIIVLILITIILITISINITQKCREYLSECDQLATYIIKARDDGPCIGLLGGVHGNEPAGSVALENLVGGHWPLSLKRGKLIVIPSANQCGLANNSRLQPGMKNRDLNRNFTSEGGTDYKSRQIADAFQDCDLVIDIHEGWGFHNIHPTSLGSTISPTETPRTQFVASEMVREVNNTIREPSKYFTQLNDISCDIPTTLSCYMNNKNREYILIEITGQNDIQHIDVREKQAQTLITTALASLDMV